MTWPAARFCFSLFGAAVHKALVYLVSMLRSVSENPVNIIYSGSVLRSASVCLVYTNMGGSLLKLPNKNLGCGHRLRKACNRSNVKISYSCIPNIAAVISQHVKRLVDNTVEERATKLRHCQVKN